MSIFDINYNMSYIPNMNILSLILNISNYQIDNQICIFMLLYCIIVNTYPEVIMQPVQYKHFKHSNAVILRSEFILTQTSFRNINLFDLYICDMDISINYDIIRKLSTYIPETLHQYYSIHSDIITSINVIDIYNSNNFNTSEISMNNYHLKSFHISPINLYVSMWGLKDTKFLKDSINALTCFERIPISIKQYEIPDGDYNYDEVISALYYHYMKKTLPIVLKVMGSLNIIGNPLVVYKEITLGAEGLLYSLQKNNKVVTHVYIFIFIYFVRDF